MQITNISKMKLQNKGAIQLEHQTSNPLSLAEDDLLFTERRKAAQYVMSRFPEHFKNTETRSLPTPEPVEDAPEVVSLTIFVDVTEQYEGALQSAADELGIELLLI